MDPDFVAPDNFPREPTESHPGNRTVPTVEQPSESFTYDETIDPAWLIHGNYEPLSWDNTSSIPVSTPGASHHQRLSPTPSIFTDHGCVVSTAGIMVSALC